MPTIDEIVDTLGRADLEADPGPEPLAPLPPIDIPPKVVKWVAKKIAAGWDDHRIADRANQKLVDWEIEVLGPDKNGEMRPIENLIKPGGHVAKIRNARARRLTEL
jgi:hypothetical protein